MTGLLGPEFAGVKGVVLENVCVILELVRRSSVERTFEGCPLGAARTTTQGRAVFGCQGDAPR